MTLPFQYKERSVQLQEHLESGNFSEYVKLQELRDRDLEDFLNKPVSTGGPTNSWLENFATDGLTLAADEEYELTINDHTGVPDDAPPYDGEIQGDNVFHTVHISVKSSTDAVLKNLSVGFYDDDNDPFIGSPWHGFRVREDEAVTQIGEPWTWTFTTFRPRNQYPFLRFHNFGDAEISIVFAISIQANRRHVFGGGG